MGHYRIDGVLGKGGMSVMYRATDIRLGRKVALKVIAEHLTEDPEFRERFVDEARNTSAIDHANVVPLYDFGEVDGLLYIAMRLVDGSDLASLIKDGPLQPDRALALLSQVAEALDNLHERGLVHLDVAVFGVTRRGSTGPRTRGGDFLGSPTYAAPEHLRGEPVDARTDAYSLACVLFACLCGRPPFQGSVPEVTEGHLNRDVPALAAQAPNVPATIDEVIRRGMAKAPAQRYATCRELIAAARQALSQPVRQRLPSVPVGPRSAGPVPPYRQQPSGPPSGYQRPPVSSSDPVRLRPPVPAGSTAFTSSDSAGANRWIAPVLVGVLAIGLIVAAIFLFSASDEPSADNNPGGSDQTTTNTTKKTLPSIKVGEDSGHSTGASR